MSFASLRQQLQDHLNGHDGDFGWFITTRVHLVASRLQAIAAYIFEASGGNDIQLTPAHYTQLGIISDAPVANPAQSLKRHYLLAMDTPLRLLERTNGNSWDEVRLTASGNALATAADPISVFEKVLSDIRFCRSPWYNQTRVAVYGEFDIHPYPATIEVLNGTAGRLTVDEFDIFVSRMRTSAEIPATIASVLEFRTLSDAQRTELRQIVKDRVEGAKVYSNWRDTALHTFTLFSLGKYALRLENELYLAANLFESAGAAEPIAPLPAPGMPPLPPAPPQKKVLLLPSDEAPANLLVPPTLPQTNSGTEAELLVGKLLDAAGWTVVYYNQKRGYGFDLWVRRDGVAYVIEVKSAVGDFGTLTLTPLEYQAAGQHGDRYLVVIVEQANSTSPTLHVIRNPRGAFQFAESQASEYSASRGLWFSSVSNFPAH